MQFSLSIFDYCSSLFLFFIHTFWLLFCQFIGSTVYSPPRAGLESTCIFKMEMSCLSYISLQYLLYVSVWIKITNIQIRTCLINYSAISQKFVDQNTKVKQKMVHIQDCGEVVKGVAERVSYASFLTKKQIA